MTHDMHNCSPARTVQDGTPMDFEFRGATLALILKKVMSNIGGIV
jgi:hypothetical protein